MTDRTGESPEAAARRRRRDREARRLKRLDPMERAKHNARNVHYRTTHPLVGRAREIKLGNDRITGRQRTRRARARRLIDGRELRSSGTWTSGCCRICSQPFTTRLPSTTCSTRCSKRMKNRIRNQRRQAKYHELRIAIFERDNWTCGICGDPVNREAKAPTLDAPVLDHVIPRARGGSLAEPTNLQCTHFYCNSVKQDRLDFVAR